MGEPTRRTLTAMPSIQSGSELPRCVNWFLRGAAGTLPGSRGRRQYGDTRAEARPKCEPDRVSRPRRNELDAEKAKNAEQGGASQTSRIATSDGGSRIQEHGRKIGLPSGDHRLVEEGESVRQTGCAGEQAFVKVTARVVQTKSGGATGPTGRSTLVLEPDEAKTRGPRVRNGGRAGWG